MSQSKVAFVTFDVAASAYDASWAGISVSLASRTAKFAGVNRGMLALDVGCGPGALTGELVPRIGAASVVAVGLVESFVAAARIAYAGEASPGFTSGIDREWPDKDVLDTVAELL